MTEIYSVGTIAVTEGSVDFVGTGTGWLPPNAKAGDQLNVAGLMMGIAEITDATHGKFAVPYPGDTGAGLPYAIFKTSSEWGTNRSLSMSTAEMIQLLSTLEVPNTGLRFDALGNFAGRSNYDDRPTAFGYLSLNGDGVGGTDAVVFAKLSGADADWSAPISFRGGVGATGPSGVLVNWRNAWVTATVYALKDGVQFGGSSYICTIAHVAGDFATDLAAGRWELTSAKGAPGNDGVLSANEEIVTAASRTITAADNGKIFIADRAGGVTFNFDPVASLGTKWLGMFKNAGAGPLTIDPDGAELIDGVATLMLGTSESAMISANGALLRSHFRGSAGGKRELLAANRTYYVRPDGNDANDGRANTAGGAFLTIQKGLDAATALDFNGFTVTIQLADGTYTAGAVVGRASGLTTPAGLVIQGNTATPANVIVQPSTAASCFYAYVPGAMALIKDLTLKNDVNGGYGLRADSGGLLHFSNVRFSGTRTHMLAYIGGVLVAKGNYSITAGASAHILAAGGTVDINDAAPTITLIGTPAFANFVVAQRNSLVECGNAIFAGAATGARFNVTYGGVLFANTDNLNFLPGSTPGTLASGAIYGSLIGGVRELLTANRTYYVRTDGNDLNTGLTNTAGGAFRNIQKAIDVAASLDCGIYSITVQVADGTYNENLLLKGLVGSGSMPVLQGNPGAPGNVIINATSHAARIGNTGATWQVNGFKVQTPGGYGLFNDLGGVLHFQNINFGACSSGHIGAVGNLAQIIKVGNYSISGGGNTHVVSQNGGYVYLAAATVTFLANVTFSAMFAYVDLDGLLSAGSMTFTLGGFTVTGTRYSVSAGGVIQVNGGGINYLPGSAPGSGTNFATAPYGLYV